MATVAEHAATQAFRLLEELEPLDELTYNRKLAELWYWIVADLDFYIFIKYSNGLTVPEHERQFDKLLRQKPLRQAAVQDFLNRYVPSYERHVKRAIVQRLHLWRHHLLGSVLEEAEGA